MSAAVLPDPETIMTDTHDRHRVHFETHFNFPSSRVDDEDVVDRGWGVDAHKHHGMVHPGPDSRQHRPTGHRKDDRWKEQAHRTPLDGNRPDRF